MIDRNGTGKGFRDRYAAPRRRVVRNRRRRRTRPSQSGDTGRPQIPTGGGYAGHPLRLRRGETVARAPTQTLTASANKMVDRQRLPQSSLPADGRLSGSLGPRVLLATSKRGRFATVRHHGDGLDGTAERDNGAGRPATRRVVSVCGFPLRHSACAFGTRGAAAVRVNRCSLEPLYYTVGSGNGFYVAEFEASISQEVGVLGVGAFLAAGKDEHVDIAEEDR
jgi:hypothetical protein